MPEDWHVDFTQRRSGILIVPADLAANENEARAVAEEALRAPGVVEENTLVDTLEIEGVRRMETT